MQPTARRARLTGVAWRYLSMIQDFGHLDEAGVDEVLVAVADELGTEEGERVVDLAVLRPIVAAYLMARTGVELPEAGPLSEDWGPLFH